MWTRMCDWKRPVCCFALFARACVCCVDFVNFFCAHTRKQRRRQRRAAGNQQKKTKKNWTKRTTAATTATTTKEKRASSIFCCLVFFCVASRSKASIETLTPGDNENAPKKKQQKSKKQRGIGRNVRRRTTVEMKKKLGKTRYKGRMKSWDGERIDGHHWRQDWIFSIHSWAAATSLAPKLYVRRCVFTWNDRGTSSNRKKNKTKQNQNQNKRKASFPFLFRRRDRGTTSKKVLSSSPPPLPAEVPGETETTSASSMTPLQLESSIES